MIFLFVCLREVSAHYMYALLAHWAHSGARITRYQMLCRVAVHPRPPLFRLSAEGNKWDLASRVGSLEAVKSQLESKLSMAVEKIATDEAILQRVRKAMAIGLSLLEDQEKNTYGDSTSEMEGISEDAE
jgi:hypothetical protein